MNKQILIILALVLLIGGGAFFYLSNSKKGTPSSSSSNPVENTFSSIKDALSKSVSLQCNFTDETGRKTTSYIKNGAVRADIEAQNEEESGSVIIKDKKMYFWSKESAFMMDLSSTEVTETPQNGSQNQGQNQENDLMAGLEKYKESCKPAVVSDAQFSPPSDVKFQDFSQMMKDAQKAMPSAMPSIDQSQYQQYLKQLTPQP